MFADACNLLPYFVALVSEALLMHRGADTLEACNNLLYQAKSICSSLLGCAISFRACQKLSVLTLVVKSCALSFPLHSRLVQSRSRQCRKLSPSLFCALRDSGLASLLLALFFFAPCLFADVMQWRPSDVVTLKRVDSRTVLSSDLRF